MRASVALRAAGVAAGEWVHLAIVIRGRDGPIAALTIYPVEHVFVIPSAVDRPVVPLWNSPDHLSVPVAIDRAQPVDGRAVLARVFLPAIRLHEGTSTSSSVWSVTA